MPAPILQQNPQATIQDPLVLALQKLQALSQKISQLESQYSSLMQAGGQVPDLHLMQTSDDVVPIAQLVQSARTAAPLMVNPRAPLAPPQTQPEVGGGTTPVQPAQQPPGTYISLPAAAGLALVTGLLGGAGGWWARGSKMIGRAREAGALEAGEEEEDE